MIDEINLKIRPRPSTIYLPQQSCFPVCVLLEITLHVRAVSVRTYSPACLCRCLGPVG